jgi:hypothetical protein
MILKKVMGIIAAAVVVYINANQESKWMLG